MATSASVVLATWDHTVRNAMAAILVPVATQASAWTSRRVTKAAPSSASVHMVSPNYNTAVLPFCLVPEQTSFSEYVDVSDKWRNFLNE
jgi:hypothetical protein